jgi:hypothetical protein
MGDLKLFQIDNGAAVELQGTALALEKPLQALIERNMEILFGVRFVGERELPDPPASCEPPPDPP